MRSADFRDAPPTAGCSNCRNLGDCITFEMKRQRLPGGKSLSDSRGAAATTDASYSATGALHFQIPLFVRRAATASSTKDLPIARDQSCDADPDEQIGPPADDLPQRDGMTRLEMQRRSHGNLPRRSLLD